MSDDLSNAIDGERSKLAKLLHDGICQDLMGASMLAQVLAANLASMQHTTADDAIQLRNLLKKAADDLHAVYAALEPDSPVES